jgi:hypothetical protein
MRAGLSGWLAAIPLRSVLLVVLADFLFPLLLTGLDSEVGHEHGDVNPLTSEVDQEATVGCVLVVHWQDQGGLTRSGGC